MIGWENVQGAYYINKLQKEIEGAESASQTIDGKIGNLSDLTTSSKTNVVSAINEVDSHADTNSGNIGDMSSLSVPSSGGLVGAVNYLDQMISNDCLKMTYLGYIMKDESMTFDVEGDSKFILAMFGTSQGRTGCYMVNVSPSGSSTILNVVTGADIAITSATNTLTVTNNTSTAERAIHMYAIVFSGSIEEHTD